MARLLKITTQSGAEYIWDIDTNLITGGSLGIKEGMLRGDVVLGQSLTIETKERHVLNPDFKEPGIVSTAVIDVRPI